MHSQIPTPQRPRLSISSPTTLLSLSSKRHTAFNSAVPTHLNSYLMVEHAAGPSSSTNPESTYDDSPLANSEYLTQQELLQRRRLRLRRLARIYRAHYWTLMEDVRRQHRDFIWKFGRDTEQNYGGVFGEPVNILHNNNSSNNNNKSSNNQSNGDNMMEDRSDGEELGFSRCVFPECGVKAMAMTRYCLRHILSDTKQVLYSSCHYPHKSGVDPILCGRPILKSSVPALCPAHVKMSEQAIKRALKKGGVSAASCNKLTPKFHLLLAQYVNVIQDKRRAAMDSRIADVEDEDISV